MKIKVVAIVALSLLFQNNIFSQSKFWGVTSEGGVDRLGLIFSTNIDGTGYSVKKHFTYDHDTAGMDPVGAVAMFNNRIFGVTRGGGANGLGQIFELDPVTKIKTKKHNFVRGRPSIGLTLFSNQKMYGMEGFSIYEFDPVTNNVRTTYEITSSLDGSPSMGELMEASNGKGYGMTFTGGANNNGVLFELNVVTGAFAKKFDFEESSSGAFPMGSLIQAADGKLYGLTSMGGIYGKGTLFSYDLSTNQFQKLNDFDGPMGATPVGTLVEAGNGRLFGITRGGGAWGVGVVFEYQPTGNLYTKKLDLDSETGYGGKGALVKGQNGKLYGVVDNGVGKVTGAFIEIDPVPFALKKKLEFDGERDGSYPIAITEGSNGKFYGLTQKGGSNNVGVVFQMDVTSTNLKSLHNFTFALNGSFPRGTLTMAPNGKFYGITAQGGKHNTGVLYEFDPLTDQLSVKVDFKGELTGETPLHGLTLAANGKLYGITTYLNNESIGLLFEYDPELNKFNKRYEFGFSDSTPWSELILASNSKLYGITSLPGYTGALFEFDPVSGSLSKKADFQTNTTGKSPIGKVLQANNGKFYGATEDGGTAGDGTIFEYDPATGQTYSRHSFQSAVSGKIPNGAMIEGTDGKLYGLTMRGGTNNNGTIFSFDPITQIVQKKLDFDGLNGAWPLGGLTKSSNGKFYGMTQIGGSLGYGVLFEFNPATNVLVKKVNFDNTNGAKPGTGSLTFIAREDQTIAFTSLASIPSGTVSFNLNATTSSGLKITYNTTSKTIKINSNVVTIIQPGSATITALQSGNVNFKPATPVDRTFCVNPPKPNLTLHDASNSLSSDAVSGNQWYLKDALVEGAANSNFTPQKSGVYKVRSRVDNCFSEFSREQSVLVPGDLKSLAHVGIVNYPNPVIDQLNIAFDEAGKKIISIYQLDGKRFVDEEFYGQIASFSMKNQPNGLYFIKVITEKSTFVLKFVKR